MLRPAAAASAASDVRSFHAAGVDRCLRLSGQMLSEGNWRSALAPLNTAHGIRHAGRGTATVWPAPGATEEISSPALGYNSQMSRRMITRMASTPPLM